MPDLSFTAMKFGDEEDFKIAITELKWIAKSFGKVKDKDFETVASKYSFPVGFLKKGLNGLKFPDDYRISKSEWFPVLFSWVCQRKERSDKLFRLQLDYERYKFSIVMTFVLLVGIFQIIGIFLQTYAGLDSLNLALLIVSFFIAAIGLFFEMRNPLLERKLALDEYKHFLELRNMSKLIEDCNNFVKKNYRLVVWAADIMKKKLQSAPQMTIFSCHVEKKTLHVDDSEFPFIEYKRRISELGLKEKENLNSGTNS